MSSGRGPRPRCTTTGRGLTLGFTGERSESGASRCWVALPVRSVSRAVPRYEARHLAFVRRFDESERVRIRGAAAAFREAVRRVGNASGYEERQPHSVRRFDELGSVRAQGTAAAFRGAVRRVGTRPGAGNGSPNRRGVSNSRTAAGYKEQSPKSQNVLVGQPLDVRSPGCNLTPRFTGERSESGASGC